MKHYCEQIIFLTCDAFPRPHRRLLERKYTTARFTRDLIAGITVGIIAIPLAMALAIGSGVPPQASYLSGGRNCDRLDRRVTLAFRSDRRLCGDPLPGFPAVWSGGTAGGDADVGDLFNPLRLARFGRLIEYIPLSVTLGFTSGIGIAIGTMQIKDFLGLQMPHVPEHYLQKVAALAWPYRPLTLAMPPSASLLLAF